MRNKIIPYDPKLKEFARYLRKNSTISEVILWGKIKKKSLGVEFHRQVPLLYYIVDFYCHELLLAIEIDGNSHLHKYDYDARRQSRLEQYGISFIRFDDGDVKNNLLHVLVSIQQKVDALKVQFEIETKN